MPRQLMYHERRVLGSLATCEENKGLPLDDFDRKHVAILTRRGFVEWVEGGGLRVYRATDAGRHWWRNFTNQGRKLNANPESQSRPTDHHRPESDH